MLELFGYMLVSLGTFQKLMILGGGEKQGQSLVHFHHRANEEIWELSQVSGFIVKSGKLSSFEF